MKIYIFGDKFAPVIMLFPGTCCHWKANFGGIIPLLEKYFHVVCVSYDGFDETEDSIFPDMLTETERIESYITEHFSGKICAAYGCSLGGSFVGLLVQRRKVHIDHAIIGSSDLDQSGGIGAKIQATIISKMLYGMFQKGKSPGFMQKWLESKPIEEREYYEKMLDMFGINSTRMSFVKKESIKNQFYSDLVTPIENDISVQDTVIHCFYAEKMGKKFLDRYKQHFNDPDIHSFNMQHEELLVCYPEKWAEEIKLCCGL
ncbi:MAG: alpha/beta hydrolase [Oscillospiraceae bacterium]|nr:alpha/beta hydrolase [Oscillospiraceae bacterium]